jgi:hypothetical protein
MEANDAADEYSFCCTDCGGRVSPGQALRGGRIVCTTCGGEIPIGAPGVSERRQP